jgi:hypothetical protein
MTSWLAVKFSAKESRKKDSVTVELDVNKLTSMVGERMCAVTTGRTVKQFFE